MNTLNKPKPKKGTPPMYTIQWICLDDPDEIIHTSGNLFLLKEANRLIAVATKHFTRAKHWVIPA